MKKLGEVVVVQRGSSPRPIKKFLTTDSDGVNWIKIGDTKNIDKYIYSTKQKITKEGAKKSRFVDVGDFILTNSMSYGKPYIMKTQGYIHDGWFVFRLPENINPDYFWYLLVSPNLKEQFESLAAGAIVKNISGDLVKKAILPIPPLIEQKKIVTLLDSAFAKIDQAKANIEKNITNAKELFQSKLNDIFSQKGDGWEKRKIIELCSHKSQIVGGPFGSNLKVKDYTESGVPILRLQNIGKGYFIDKAIKFVSKEKAEELSYHSFESGDIVLAKLGIPIGKTCIVPEKYQYGIVVADVVRIRPNKELINYDFLKHFLNSDNSVNQLTADIRGATRPRVNIKEVRNLELSVPELKRQVKVGKLINDYEKHRNDLISN